MGGMHNEGIRHREYFHGGIGHLVRKSRGEQLWGKLELDTHYERVWLINESDQIGLNWRVNMSRKRVVSGLKCNQNFIYKPK